MITGFLVNAEGNHLPSGQVGLYDPTGCIEEVYNPVDADGSYEIAWGRGDFVLRGEDATGICGGAGVPISTCGLSALTQDVPLDCGS